MNFAIVLSGGTGSRLPGLGVPKQYYKAGQKPVIAYSLETLAEIGMFQKLLIWRSGRENLFLPVPGKIVSFLFIMACCH